MLTLAPKPTLDRLLRTGQVVQAEPMMVSGISQSQVFEDLYRVHYPQLVIFFGRRGFDPERSRDLAQEAMIRAYKNLDRFEHRSQIRTWLLQIATHLAQNWIRDQQRTQKRGADETSLEEVHQAGQQFSEAHSLWGAESLLDPEQLAMNREAREQVKAAMEVLSPRQRQCLTLWLEHHKYREIAGQLGISTQAVKSILNQAKERVRRHLSEGTTVTDARRGR